MFYTAKEIQNLFLNYFKNKEHIIIPGSSIIPENDKTLLFTNAGMNQFKDYFTQSLQSPYDSTATSQRCIRAGGKHNDLEQVGFTSRHLTHFSMLGNFSFGSYFKKEAIFYAWDFLTNTIKLDKNLLWITIYKDDEEAFLIWKNDIKIDESKISRLGEKDNFWQMGDVGPCGPCSEIYFDKGIKTQSDRDSFPGDNKSERFMEIWNLVFMQYEKLPNGTLSLLKKFGVDTGMGLERLVSVVQSKESIFQTDLFMPLINHIEEKSTIKYEKKSMPIFHVLCDHIRTSSLLIHSGIAPSNEGRGYVLRKIIRRALLFSKKISDKNSFFASLIDFFISTPSLLYTDLLNKKDIIHEIILNESIKFFDNLALGINLFSEFADKQKNNIFSGIDAFTLYDTHGFPLEITSILAEEKNLKINIEEYEKEMLKQKNKSKENQKFKNTEITINTNYQTQFLGYTDNYSKGIIKEIHTEYTSDKEENTTSILIIDKTVFYPTGGGQIHDSGYITINGEKIQILNVKKYNNAIGLTIHTNIKLKTEMEIEQYIDLSKRIESQKHHSAVHLLHHFISIYFKDKSIYQNGSFVCDEYFTLDVVMKQKVSYEDKKNLEILINKTICEGHNIISQNMTLDEAEKIGAVAQFTEKYNKDNVRVINIDKVTTDLCGGCHAKNTNELGFFIIKDIISGGTDIKRFIGSVGNAAYSYIRQMEEIILKTKTNLSCQIENINEEISKKNEQLKAKDKELDKVKINYSIEFADNIIKSNINIKKIFVELPSILKSYEQHIINKIKNIYTICCFYTKKSENIYLVYCYINNNLDTVEKTKIEQFFNETLKFKGRLKNDIYQGTIEFNNINIFNSL